MSQLLGIHIKNYRALSDVTLGQIAYGVGEPLPMFSCFIGPNGCGKSTLLDAFGFLADALREGVEGACDKPQRGGFQKLRTQGCNEPIEFTLYYRQEKQSRPITYSFAVDEREGVPIVVRELLRQRRKGQSHGQPYPFLRIENGVGRVWAGESTENEEGATSMEVKLSDLSRLAITTLGQFKEHPRIEGLRRYIEGWYLSYFVPDAARTLPPSGAQKHLDRRGENVANVVQFMERYQKGERFKNVLSRIAKKIPGIKSITHTESPDRRLLLEFNEDGYTDPFFQPSMSDGTLKLFTYYLLMEDPEPRPFIGIEEPENGLYHKLLEGLAREMRKHAENSAGKTQVLVTTHSPHFVDALLPNEVWLLEKNEKGRIEVKRVMDIPFIKSMSGEGLTLGSLWYSNHFEERFGK
jgi:predicted ATPase